jgi:hypothetical protein
LLDCPITDAAPGVELVWLSESSRGASFETSGASAAVIGVVRRIISQLDIDQECTQKGKAPQATVDEHRVLADPA